jgi:uncharacterized protein (DUF58 family)
MNAQEILKTVRHIEIRTRRTLNSSMVGAYHSTFKGNGMEFSEVREYVPGDDVRSIDWNVTARTGKPHIKKFVEERELTLMIAVDASASGNFGGVGHLKKEVMATVSALLAFTASKNNDKVGLLIFTDTIEKVIPAAKGRKHILRMVRELLFFVPQSPKTNINGVLSEIHKTIKRSAMLAIVSDFYDQDYSKALQLVNQRHEVLPLVVRDPREFNFPNVGMIELQDPETGEIILVDSSSRSFRKAYSEKQSLERQITKKNFTRIAIEPIFIEIDSDYKKTLTPILNYFRRRASKSAT